MASVVNKDDIKRACLELGIKSDDTVIIHSSLKSFGYVEGGAEAVIDAFKETLSDGTLCFPALNQKNFARAYIDWNIKTTPSDVGFLSETFRLLPDTLRSDQETHSVTAWGVNAKYITDSHRVPGTERLCLWGNYAFSRTSPWQRIYELGGKVIFLGVQMRFNTIKHLVECIIVDDILSSIPDEDIKKEASSEVANCFPGPNDIKRPIDENGKPGGFWFWYDGVKMEELFDEMGLIKTVRCGDSKIMCVDIPTFVKEWYHQLRYNYDGWMKERYCAWLRKYDIYDTKGENK